MIPFFYAHKVIPCRAYAMVIHCTGYYIVPVSNLSILSTCHFRRLTVPRTHSHPFWYPCTISRRKSECNRYICRIRAFLRPPEIAPPHPTHGGIPMFTCCLMIIPCSYPVPCTYTVHIMYRLTENPTLSHTLRRTAPIRPNA